MSVALSGFFLGLVFGLVGAIVLYFALARRRERAGVEAPAKAFAPHRETAPGVTALTPARLRELER